MILVLVDIIIILENFALSQHKFMLGYGTII